MTNLNSDINLHWKIYILFWYSVTFFIAHYCQNSWQQGGKNGIWKAFLEWLTTGSKKIGNQLYSCGVLKKGLE